MDKGELQIKSPIQMQKNYSRKTCWCGGKWLPTWCIAEDKLFPEFAMNKLH